MALMKQITASRSSLTFLSQSSLLCCPFSSSSSEPTLTIETSIPFTAHQCEPPSRSITTSPTELLIFFKDMETMRQMEIVVDSLYKSKLIHGFCHLYDGQEVVAVGMEAAITKKDLIITAYRDHYIYLCRGGTLVKLLLNSWVGRLAAIRGKVVLGISTRKMVVFFCGHGIVGDQVPLGCGLAFADKYEKDGNVSFALYGDGAVNERHLFEALNMLALLDLPAILVCENNHYEMGTAEWRAAKSPSYYKRGDYVAGLKV